MQRAALFQNEGVTFDGVPSVDDIAAEWGEITDLSAAQAGHLQPRLIGVG